MRPMRPLIPPPPGTKKADELRSIEADLFDAFLVVQELLNVGGARCITLAAGGMVNIVTGEDHPPEPNKGPAMSRAQAATDAVEAYRNDGGTGAAFEIADAVVAALAKYDAEYPPAPAQPKPVIKRFLGINLIESLLAAGAAGYEQIEKVGRQTTNEQIKQSVQAFVDHVKRIREVRTKRIIAP